MEQYEKELKVGSQDDMLAHASEKQKETNGFSGFDGIIGLALVSALFGGEDTNEIKEVMEGTQKPTTLKSLEKQFKITTNTLFEIFSLQQKRISELESKLETIKKAIKR